MLIFFLLYVESFIDFFFGWLLFAVDGGFGKVNVRNKFERFREVATGY